MQRWSIGEVCRALGVKPHIVRYWEQEIGILSPSKDLSGRRVYTLADVQLLFRVKHLVQDRKFTVYGAAQQILSETSGASGDAKAHIHRLRSDLLSMLSLAHGRRDRLWRALGRHADTGSDDEP